MLRLKKDLSRLISFVYENMFFSFSDAPRVQLALGKSIVPSSIYEGGDVYFDCRVKSRPPPLRILWQQNVSIFITLY